MPKLSIVLPTYEEGENIGPLIHELRNELEGVDLEIIVVDDASKDDTAQRAREAGARVIVREDERGLGTAVVRGIDEASGTYVAVMDADFQHPPATIRRMLQRADEKDAHVVIGSRYAPGGGEAGFTPARRATSIGAGLMARILLPPVRRHRLTDPMSGLFLVRRDRIDVGALRPKGYKVLLEILARSEVERVEEVGYVFRDRRGGESKLGFEVMLQYVVHLLALAWLDARNQRVLRFGLVGASGILVNLGILYLLHGLLGIHDLIAVPLAVEASIISNFLLNDLFTFRDRRAGSRVRRLAQFNTVSLVALVVNFTAYAIFTRIFGVFYLVAQLLAILIAFSVNYLGNLHWTYGKENRFQLRRFLRRAAPWLPLALVVGAAGTLYFSDLDTPAGIYYDEGHYVSAAKQFENDVWHDPCWVSQPYRPVNNPHPPLAKLIMAASMERFDTNHFVFEGCRAPTDTENGGKHRYDGFLRRLVDEGNPYAWRGPSALMATLTVAGIGLGAAWILRSPYLGAFAAMLVGLDNMVLAMGRTAMLDIYAAGFAALALAAAARPTKAGLLASTIFLGLGFASKFVVAFVGPAVLFIAWWVRHREGRLTRGTAIASAIAYPVTALGILTASYLPWWRIWIPQFGFTGAIRHFVDILKQMVSWGTGAQFSQRHPDQSVPLDWLIMKRPSFMFSPRDGLDGYLFAVGNPVLWWTALAVIFVALAFFLWRAAPAVFTRNGRSEPRRKTSRDAQALILLALVPLFALAPFFLINRPQFLFYMAFIAPFFALPLAAAAKLLIQHAGQRGLIALALFLVAVSVVYWHYFPLTYGLPTTAGEAESILRLLPWTDLPNI